MNEWRRRYADDFLQESALIKRLFKDGHYEQPETFERHLRRPGFVKEK